jgi:hypothetical protein
MKTNQAVDTDMEDGHGTNSSHNHQQQLKLVFYFQEVLHISFCFSWDFPRVWYFILFCASFCMWSSWAHKGLSRQWIIALLDQCWAIPATFLSNSAVYFLLSQPWEILWGNLFHIMRYKKHPLAGKTLIQKQEWIDNDKLSEAASNCGWWTGSLIHTSLHILHCPEKWMKSQCDCRESLQKRQLLWVSRSSRKIM